MNKLTLAVFVAIGLIATTVSAFDFKLTAEEAHSHPTIRINRDNIERNQESAKLNMRAIRAKHGMAAPVMNTADEAPQGLLGTVLGMAYGL